MANQYERGSEWRRWDLHLHTASSYDARYKSDDADDLLCKALVENDIAAAAITDHFKIDYERIEHLRELAPNITFFPGVELRTDKGASNLHIILIFSEEKDVKTLADDFNAIMLRGKAKATESDEKIFWNFEDIIEFAKKQNALITIHAGKKTNGIDKEITNAVPVGEAIKEDIAKSIDFFEVGNSKDIDDYYKHVFNCIDEKPLIMCSDCHNPKNYSVKEKLWIKANPTFEGLLQCIYQPKERVFVGPIPPALDKKHRNGRSIISRISTKRIPQPKNTIYNWLNFNLELNSGLVAIIGNKGSGKSALADILGHLCKCSTMDHASFLNTKRFRKSPKNYADDYESIITWGDLHSESSNLTEMKYNTTIENAQYLPQKYIEDVCNDIDSIFQEEINSVIFSYVDKTERGEAKNLDELVSNKSKTVNLAIKKIQGEMDDINLEIIRLEKRKTTQYRTSVQDNLKKLMEDLDRHLKSIPKEVKQPDSKENDNDYSNKLLGINTTISSIEEQINQTNAELTRVNEFIDDTNQLIARINLIGTDIEEINTDIGNFVQYHELDNIEMISMVTPVEALNRYIKELMNKRKELQTLLNGSTDEPTDKQGLKAKLLEAKQNKDKLISTANSEEKVFQKYLSDYKEWEEEKKRIEGNSTAEGSIAYFEAELKFLEEELESDYKKARERREAKISELFKTKLDLVNIYKEIYSPVESEISKLLGELEEKISFEAEVQLSDNNLSDTLLRHINKSIAGVFRGKTESQNKMNQLIRETEFKNSDSILNFIKEVMKVVDEDIDSSDRKISDKEEFYKKLCCIDYIGVAFKLKVGNRNLEELSPGERGIVLLVFYLALSKNSIPIIIDQPEDNLDNQSVYSKLVPCILEAKKKRQVIIVTHNPNIAIACDAEQIIFSDINKTDNEIKYEAGAIEDPRIKEHVIDVLEGTLPAFDLRKRKYFEYNRLTTAK